MTYIDKLNTIRDKLYDRAEDMPSLQRLADDLGMTIDDIEKHTYHLADQLETAKREARTLQGSIADIETSYDEDLEKVKEQRKEFLIPILKLLESHDVQQATQVVRHTLMDLGYFTTEPTS